MPVAKSYAKLEQIDKPFKDKGRMYVKVKGTNGIKTVRWYSASEYAKMYPEEKKSDVLHFKSQKEVLGFEKGYITIFSGITPDTEWWFEQHAECRYTRWWGWYVPSTDNVPKDYPEGINEVRLLWAPMGREDDWLMEESIVLKHVKDTLSAVAGSKYKGSRPQGKIGDRLLLQVEVIGKETQKNERYKTETHFYTLKDEKDNVYQWKTQAKNWKINTKHRIRGTVKEHEGEITILTRCMEQ